VALFTLAGPAQAAVCHAGTYAYAGLGSRSSVRAVAATIVPTTAPAVRDGHVAGWVGVGGYGVGPGGTDEWLQIGIIAGPRTPSAIYVEVARPGKQPFRRTVRAGVALGEHHRFAIVESSGHANWWRVLLDGRATGAPVFLAGSHARLAAQITGESYAGLSEGACNLYSFSFEDVSVAPMQSVPTARLFDLFQDANYLFTRSSSTSFVARSAGARS
jgi:hypothetical protein